ncbi:MAG: hypothetical protein U5L10_01920 [Candidatus Moranbacteria bacterium]|nr:hypothetical protein [Candidatus Moranbacteria bacterium]
MKYLNKSSPISCILLLALFSLLFSFSTLGGNNASAVVMIPSGEDGAEDKTIADISISQLKVVEQKDHQVKLSFAVYNLSNRFQPDVEYGIRLFRKEAVESEHGTEEEGTSSKEFHPGDVLYEKIDPESMDLSPGEKIDKKEAYEMPSHLEGEFLIQLFAKTSSGLFLGMAETEVVKMEKGEDGIELDHKECRLLKNSNTEEEYALSDPIYINSQEQLAIKCLLSNDSPETRTIMPAFDIYEESIFGEKIETESNPGKISIEPKESREISLNVPKTKSPGSYYAALHLKQGEAAVSNRIYFNYAVEGLSASIYDIKANQEENQNISVSFYWSGIRENFAPGTQERPSPKNQDLQLSLRIVDQHGKDCASPVTKSLSGEKNYSEFSTSVIKSCASPYAEAKIKNQKGEVLDEIKVRAASMEKKEKKEAAPGENASEDNALILIASALIVLFLIFLLWWLLVKKKLLKKSFLALFVFLSAFVFLAWDIGEVNAGGWKWLGYQMLGYSYQDGHTYVYHYYNDENYSWSVDNWQADDEITGRIFGRLYGKHCNGWMKVNGVTVWRLRFPTDFGSSSGPGTSVSGQRSWPHGCAEGTYRVKYEWMFNYDSSGDGVCNETAEGDLTQKYKIICDEAEDYRCRWNSVWKYDACGCPDEYIESCPTGYCDYGGDVDYYCSGDKLMGVYDYVRQGCRAGACYTGNVWHNSCGSFVKEDCSDLPNYCEEWDDDWTCKDETTKMKSRECYNSGCSSASCYGDSYTETKEEECLKDGVQGRCINGACFYQGACGSANDSDPTCEAPKDNLCLINFYDDPVVRYDSADGDKSKDKYYWTCEGADQDSDQDDANCSVERDCQVTSEGWREASF